MPCSSAPQLHEDIGIGGPAPGATDAPPSTPRGYTPAELGRLLRVRPDQVRAWIKSGELGAIDTARLRCGRPRFIILPHHLAEFERRRAAAAPKPVPRRRRPAGKDYYPD
jgi:hypothetical protein